MEKKIIIKLKRLKNILKIKLFFINKTNINIKNTHHFEKYNNTFIIIKYNCKICGLFCYFVNFLNCINTFINKGYIPILDLISFPNIFNKFNSLDSHINPWEIYFHQPFQFSLEEVKANSKNIIYFVFNNMSKNVCKSYGMQEYFFKNKVTLEYWHNIALKYIPIKKNIFDESKVIIQKLFKNKKNILGILLRGTDYISLKSRGLPIQPNTEIVINDIVELDKKNKYDFFFLTTEDEIIFQMFRKKFGKKLKYYHKKLNYNYNQKNYIAYNKNILGNSS